MGESWLRWITVLGGALLIAAGLRDMFHTLFHPGGTGSLSSWVAGTVWRLSQRMARWRPSARRSRWSDGDGHGHTSLSRSSGDRLGIGVLAVPAYRVPVRKRHA